MQGQPAVCVSQPKHDPVHAAYQEVGRVQEPGAWYAVLPLEEVYLFDPCCAPVPTAVIAPSLQAVECSAVASVSLVCPLCSGNSMTCLGDSIHSSLLGVCCWLRLCVLYMDKFRLHGRQGPDLCRHR
jgi:hypothetical protein